MLLRKQTKSDYLFDVLSITTLIGFTLLILYPLYFILIASISDPNRIYSGDVWFWPEEITFEGYSRMFRDSQVWYGFRNSLFYAGVGSMISVILTVAAAYPLSRRDLPGHRAIMGLLIFTLFFSGGLIPNYLLVKQLGMVNTVWAILIPSAVTAFDIIIARTFFQSTIPDEVREAAAMDGCTNLRFLGSVVLPLSKPIVAVLVLFAVVRQWNSFFDALIYLENEKLYPLQLVLRNILIQNQPNGDLISDIDSLVLKQRISELIKYGIIVIAAVPLLVLYPFLQRYFVKGVLVGSVKG